MFAETGQVRLHYLDHDGGGPTLILLPGLTANAHSFGGLLQAGLADHLRVLAVDLRGRGQSDAPDGLYDVATHAADVLGFMDALNIDRAIVGGHSFGGLVSYYLAANHPDRVSACVAMDAPAEVHIGIMDQIKPSLDRLGMVFPSWDEYLALVKAAPYFNGWWDPAIEEYYRRDLRTNPDGTVQAISDPEHIRAAALATLDIQWPEIVRRIGQPTLLLRAPDQLGSADVGPIVTREVAERTLGWIENSTLVEIPGNHITFLFGDSAPLVVAEIQKSVGV
ncbi:MAG: alpha/beta hydrolase [bacterium]|nr:alpha/beta hydrolase [bacterium]